MTISKVIERSNQIRPSAISHEEIAGLVLQVEASIYDIYLERPLPVIEGWDAELFAPFPYDTVYLDYVISKIDQINGDSELYALSSAQYTISMNQLGSHLIRSGKSKLTLRSEERIF